MDRMFSRGDKYWGLLKETWVYTWIGCSIAGCVFWGIMVREIRRNKRIPARITMIFLLGLLTAVEFCSFIQLLRIAPYRKFSFLASVVGPCVIFYTDLFVFLNGVSTAINKACCRKKFNVMTGFNAYLPYSWCIPIAELAWSMAYSCNFGIILSGFKAVLTGIQYWLYFVLKKVGRKGNKKKGHKEA